VLSVEMVGPATAADYAFALSAVQGWQADWPRPFRVRVLLFAVIFCVLGLATTLLGVQRRRSVVSASLYPAAMIILSAGTCVVVWRWFGSRSPVLERTGAMVIADRNAGVAQRDTWRFYASASQTRTSAPWHGLTIPFFEERAQRRASQIALICDETGQPVSFEFRLVPSLKVALLTRGFERWTGKVSAAQAGAAESPLAFQLGRAYLNRPLAPRGQLEAAPLDPPAANTEAWPTLLVE
jgi:hypothetical protein